MVSKKLEVLRELSMSAEDILENWDVDSKIDPLKVEVHLREISSLQSKYLRFLYTENKLLRILEARLKKLNHLKTEYYSGELNNPEDLTKYGWEPYQRRILKGDVPRFVESDNDIIKLTEQIGEQKEKVSILTYILKEIMQRNFHLRGIIDNRKFEAGVL